MNDIFCFGSAAGLPISVVTKGANKGMPSKIKQEPEKKLIAQVGIQFQWLRALRLKQDKRYEGLQGTVANPNPIKLRGWQSLASHFADRQLVSSRGAYNLFVTAWLVDRKY